MRRFSEPITFGSDDASKRTRDQGRRNGRRLPAPIGLFVLVLPDQFVRLELSISLEGCGSPVDCFLYDVNKGGVGVVCAEQLQVGARVQIHGELAVSEQPELDVNAILVDRREFPPERPRPRGFEGQELYVHGLSMDPCDARVLLNATQECVDIIRREVVATSSGGAAPHGMLVEELDSEDVAEDESGANAERGEESLQRGEESPQRGVESPQRDEAPGRSDGVGKASAEEETLEQPAPASESAFEDGAVDEVAAPEPVAAPPEPEPVAPPPGPVTPPSEPAAGTARSDPFASNMSFGYLPIAEVEMTEEEVRRRSTRDDITVDLCLQVEGEDQPRSIDLRIRKEGTEVKRAVHSEMLNFSPEGARLLANLRLKVGERVLVTGFCAAQETVLFELPFTVRNFSPIERMRGAIAKRARAMGDQAIAVGVELDEGVENLLYKAALDSIYLAARNNKG